MAIPEDLKQFQIKTVDFSDKGITVVPFNDVYLSVQQMFRSIYGSGLYLEPDSMDGQLCLVIALAMYDLSNVLSDLYNSFSPYTAQGVNLSRLVKINGITRKIATNSSVDLLLTGDAGTLIQNGAASDGNNKWLLPKTVTIPVEGEITVTATAENEGDIQAPANSITKISTPVRGWKTVTNPVAATAGDPVETDYELRERQIYSVAEPSLTVMDGILGGIAQVTGVQRLKGYENFEPAPDVNGIPANSFCFVVQGGDNFDIAHVIAKRKTPGIPSFGNTKVLTYDDENVMTTIRFQRPTIVDVFIKIEFKARTGYISATGEQVKQNLVDFIMNKIDIGGTIYLYQLYAPIMAAEPIEGVTTFDVVSLSIGRTEEDTQAANLILSFDEIAEIDVGKISLVVPII